MTPLLLFLLGCLAVYLGAIGSAFSALMKLSLRIIAERSDRPDALAAYLEDPILLFTPVRVLLGVVTVTATSLIADVIGVDGLHKIVFVILFGALFVGVFEMLLPLLIVGREPERVLELLLPTFSPLARALAPVTELTRRLRQGRRAPAVATPEEPAAEDAPEGNTLIAPGDTTQIAEGEERRLLKSIVDFGDTLVREVMTPRPDIVGIRDDATVGELRALFREQEYSRFPVFKDSLDNIAGFVFVKDLVALDTRNDDRPVRSLLRPAVFVPESKRVPELLKQFQRQRTQIAIVVDEYGGTAGLVTIEDMLEEIVGEIRDEYDVEAEPVLEEGDGQYLVNGNADVDEIAQRLNVQIDREGFETVGGYLLAHLGRVPAIGERLEVDGLQIEVLDVQRRRINKVRIARQPIAQPAAGEQPA